MRVLLWGNWGVGELQGGGVIVGNCNMQELWCGEFWFGVGELQRGELLC